MRIWEVRELKFHWTFFLFPVNPTFFLCVFRSGRSFSFHIGLKGQCLEFAGFCGKNTSQRMSQGRFFRQTWKGLTLQTREEHVTTFAYWNDKNDLPAGGLLNEEDLQVGKQGESSCSPFSPLGNCLCGREKQVCREFTFRYSCAGFQRLFSRKTVCDAMHRWRFGECASWNASNTRLLARRKRIVKLKILL